MVKNFILIQSDIQLLADETIVYVIRTSVPESKSQATVAVRTYRSLAGVERTFRGLKTVDLLVCPIQHRLIERIRFRVVLHMLVFHVEWHIRWVWVALLFAEDDH